MNIIIFGPQGSGKGTQADILAEKYHLYHLSMGDELRKEIKRGTKLGKKIASIINNGTLVSNKMTEHFMGIVSKKKECKNGIIFDGYPRRHGQWLFVRKHFDIDAAIEIHIPEKESVKRISTRRICPKCGKNYNTIWLKPKKSGYCDIDHSKLIQRIDDKPKEIKKRLRTYHRETEPLKKEYAKHKILHRINGSQPIKNVNKDIVKILDSIRK